MDINMSKGHCNFLYGIFLFSLFPFEAIANDACTNPAISFLVNRPANAVSPCTVSPEHFMIEGGYQRRNWTTGSYANIYPNIQLRLGLPEMTEIYTYLPIYVDNHASPFAGNTTAAVGGKHKIWGNETFIFSVDGLVILPGGTANYVTKTGEHLNGVLSYIIDDKWSLLFMVSWYHQTQSSVPSQIGNHPSLITTQYFSGVGPDAVLSYVFTPKMSVYAEIFGQSKVSPTLGSGYNVNTGMIFTLRNNITFDIEFASRLSGQLGQLTNYFGAGVSIQL